MHRWERLVAVAKVYLAVAAADGIFSISVVLELDKAVALGPASLAINDLHDAHMPTTGCP